MYSRKFPALAVMLILSAAAWSQTVSQKLEKSLQIFLADSQMISGLAGFVVMDANTGKILFNHNGAIGMAPASTQKVITAATAYEILGPNYRYETKFEEVKINLNIEAIRITPSGDPTLGSFRWKYNNAVSVLQRLNSVRDLAIKGKYRVFIDTSGWQHEPVTAGWIWEDLGNYYGASTQLLNWRENQYDVVLSSGEVVGTPVRLAKPTPQRLISQVTAAGKGTGDNAYVYPGLFDTVGLIKGTIPINEDSFTISASHTNPARWFLQDLGMAKAELPTTRYKMISRGKLLHTEVSPTLDSISYWFLQKSVNLYGEALIQTLAKHKEGRGGRQAGIRILKALWQAKGISPTALNMMDGSGLSPMNRVTPEAQVKVLQYAYAQPWYTGFFKGFPLYNGMKMKSGTIRNVKGFTGYHTSAAGTTYIFSFLVNNYAGSASSIVRKMYAVLDELK